MSGAPGMEITDRLEKMFAMKRESTHHFRATQARLGAIAEHLIDTADWRTRDGGTELHKGLHWISLEYSEFLNEMDKVKRNEELADVLHFILEFCLLSGIGADVIPPGDQYDRLDVVFLASLKNAFVFEDAETNARFGILATLATAEMIKNKPWKQTLKTERDEAEFLTRVRGIWFWFGATCRTHGLTPDTLFAEYARKEKINANRIATGV